MYIIREDFLGEASVEGKEARMELVDFLRDWSVGVFEEASKVESITRAGQIIRYRVLENQGILERVFREVVLVDMSDFWVAIRGEKGNRDDVVLYGIFTIIFSELDEGIKEESDKFLGEIGFAPRLRIDLSERDQKEIESKSVLDIFKRKEVEEEEEEYEEEVIELEIEDEIVDVGDEIVTEANVQLLTKVVVGVIVILIIVIAWVVII